jgi:hypothetical protein
MSIRSRILCLAASLGGSWVLAACATHDGRPAFRAALAIGERGISVPLPPPSLRDAPRQKIDVHATVVGDEVPAEAKAWVVDLRGEAEAIVPLHGAAEFSADGLVVDLEDNCLELWIEDEDGSEGEHSFFSAAIAYDDVHVTVVDGCR